MLFQVYEINKKTSVFTQAGEGNHREMGELMDRLRHRPIPKGQDRPAQALWQGRRLVSSTY